MVSGWEIDREGRLIRFPWLDVRSHPAPVPSVDIGAAPLRHLCVNAVWATHVTGVIDRLTERDAWSGTEPEIDRAIAAMDEILLQLSEVLDECPESQVETIIERVTETVFVYAGGGGIAEETMPCISINDLLKMENGILYGRNSCCEWVEIGAFTPASEVSPVNNPVVGTDEEILQGNACGKISGLVRAIEAMLAAAEDTYGVPGEFYAAVRAAVPGGVELGRIALNLLLFDYISFRKVFSYGSLVNETMSQLMLCKGVLGMNDETGAVTYDEYEFAVNSIRSAIYDSLPQATAFAVWTVWEQCYQTIGIEDSRFLMSLGAMNLGGDCACPDDGGETGFDWDFKYDLTADANGWGHNGIDGFWVEGVGYCASTSSYRLDLRRATWSDGLQSILAVAEIEVMYTGGIVDAAYSEGWRHQNSVGFITLIPEGDFSSGDGLYSAADNLPISLYADNVLMQFKMEWTAPTSTTWCVTKIRLAGFGPAPTGAPFVAYQ